MTVDDLKLANIQIEDNLMDNLMDLVTYGDRKVSLFKLNIALSRYGYQLCVKHYEGDDFNIVVFDKNRKIVNDNPYIVTEHIDVLNIDIKKTLLNIIKDIDYDDIFDLGKKLSGYNYNMTELDRNDLTFLYGQGGLGDELKNSLKGINSFGELKDIITYSADEMNRFSAAIKEMNSSAYIEYLRQNGIGFELKYSGEDEYIRYSKKKDMYKFDRAVMTDRSCTVVFNDLILRRQMGDYPYLKDKQWEGYLSESLNYANMVAGVIQIVLARSNVNIRVYKTTRNFIVDVFKKYGFEVTLNSEKRRMNITLNGRNKDILIKDLYPINELIASVGRRFESEHKTDKNILLYNTIIEAKEARKHIENIVEHLELELDAIDEQYKSINDDIKSKRKKAKEDNVLKTALNEKKENVLIEEVELPFTVDEKVTEEKPIEVKESAFDVFKKKNEGMLAVQKKENIYEGQRTVTGLYCLTNEENSLLLNEDDLVEMVDNGFISLKNVDILLY